MYCGDDGVAQHHLLISGIHTNLSNGILDSEDVGQQIFEFLTQIIVGPFGRIGFLL